MKSYEKPLTLWGLLWALPVTLAGILVALLSLSSWGLKDGMIVCRGNRGLAWLFLGRGGFAGMTLGRVVLVVRPLSRALWMHEMEHARQAERWGLLFLPAYLVRHLRYGYDGNPFERDAIGVAAEFEADYPEEAREVVA